MITCPVCGFCGDILAYHVDDEAREVVRLVAAMPESVRREAPRHLLLHKAPGSRRLTWNKMRRLLEELAALTADRPELWAEAMRLCWDKFEGGELKTPLKNHNYLKAVADRLQPTDLPAVVEPAAARSVPAPKTHAQARDVERDAMAKTVLELRRGSR